MDAFVSGDVTLLEGLLAENLIYTHTNGSVDTKRSIINSICSSKTRYLALKPSRMTCIEHDYATVLSGECAVSVRVRVKAEDSKKLESNIRFTSVYARCNNEWQMIVWHSSLLE